MLKIPNPNNTSLDEILLRLELNYPGVEKKKPWIGPEFLKVKRDNYFMIVRNNARRKRLIVDLNPPVLWSIIGMAVFCFLLTLIFSLLVGRITPALGGATIAIGFLITKAIFQNKKKPEMEQFRADVEGAISPHEGNLF